MIYGIYRERARSAALVTIMLDRAAAIAQAEALGTFLVAEATSAHDLPETIRYNDPAAPRVIHRAGDWDSRSAWQPYMAR